MTKTQTFYAAAFSVLLAAGAAFAQAPAARYGGGAILAAVNSGTVGEQADGYLGFVRPATSAEAELQRAVNENTIRRRAVYGQMARDNGETIDRVAVVAALRQITQLQNGEYFRDQSGRWCAKSAGARIEAAADDTIVIRCAP